MTRECLSRYRCQYRYRDQDRGRDRDRDRSRNTEETRDLTTAAIEDFSPTEREEIVYLLSKLRDRAAPEDVLVRDAADLLLERIGGP